MTENNTDQFLEKFDQIPPFSIGQKAFIVNDSGEVLIIRRAKNNTLSQIWDMPGGRLDFGESVREGLAREVKEEVGLDLEIISVPLSITTFFPKAKRNNQVMRVIYLCSASGEIELSHEHDSYEWIKPTAYEQYVFPDIDYNTAFRNFQELDTTLFEFIGDGMLEESIQYRKSAV